jgi:transporter family protein
MNNTVLLGGIAMLLAWGVWGLAIKMATKELGMQALIWGQLAAIGLYPLYFVLFRDMLPLKIHGIAIGWALLGGALGVLGTIILYILLRAAPLSKVIPLSGLYPLVTVVLGFVFLREDISPQRVVGIALALLAIWFLSS